MLNMSNLDVCRGERENWPNLGVMHVSLFMKLKLIVETVFTEPKGAGRAGAVSASSGKCWPPAPPTAVVMFGAFVGADSKRQDGGGAPPGERAGEHEEKELGKRERAGGRPH